MSEFYGGWRPYVPVAQRRAQALLQVEKLRKEGVDVQPVEVEGRTIARSFWGKGWCTHLESFGDYSNRLPRGRTYVRNGSVCHLSIGKGAVEAIVSGSELYSVSVKIDPLKTPKWAKLKQQCTGKIGSLIELLQGRLSEEILGVVVDREDGLFPLPGEISYQCDCPDWAGMCKHIAAVMYGIGARLDWEPELLFSLRGVDHEDLISAEASVDAIAGGSSKRGRRRALTGGDLEGVFGVELEHSPDPGNEPKVKKGGSKRARKKSAKKKIPRPARDQAAKKATARKRTTKKKAADRSGAAATKRKKAGGKPSGQHRRRTAPFKPSARTIAALRRRVGMNKSEFARAVGVSPTTIANWEASSGPLILHEKSLAGLVRLNQAEARGS